MRRRALPGTRADRVPGGQNLVLDAGTLSAIDADGRQLIRPAFRHRALAAFADLNRLIEAVVV
ncbi:MAG: hypothetical protein ACRDSP_22645 [Pseudonocardiaceae bacterium]